jgi:prophage antirepressor-like protein
VSQEIVPFEFNGNQVRTLLIDGEPWLVAKDVCDVLGLGNTSQALVPLDEDEKGVTTADTPGGPQQMAVVNEPGFYSLVFRSRKEEAKAFRRWVTHTVLPELRETGMYVAPALRQQLPSADKPLELKLAQYQAKLDRELMRKGLYRNTVTGQIEPLPGTVQDKDIDRKLDEHIQRKVRRANRSADSPYQTRDEQRRNGPWEDNLGDQ